VGDHAEATRDDLLEHLVGWRRIRSVSANPDNSPDMVGSAHWLATVLRDTGFPEVEVWRTAGARAVDLTVPVEDEEGFGTVPPSPSKPCQPNGATTSPVPGSSSR